MQIKKIIYNSENLKDSDMEEVVNRVKVLLINEKQELLLGYANGIYQFVGGHVEDNENFIETIKRELLEETGIEVEIENIEPYMVIKHYSKKYYSTLKSRISGIYYFVIEYNSPFDLSKTNYTEDEINGGFTLEYININDIEKKLIDNIPMNDKNKVIAYEMIEAIKEYKKIL